MNLNSSLNDGWTATTDGTEADRRLTRLLPLNVADNVDMISRIRRLHASFRIFQATCPAPPYAPGLALTPEIHRQVNIYLPTPMIRRALDKAIMMSVAAPAPLAGTIADSAASWYDVLQYLEQAGLPGPADPGCLIHSVLTDYDYRKSFLFALYLPRHYGGGFDRYPEQLAFLSDLITKKHSADAVMCLDAACGTGEQTWDLAGRLVRQRQRFILEGLSLNPFEVFAAAHGFFPQEPNRQNLYRNTMTNVLQSRHGHVAFRAGDILRGVGKQAYDIILCNGLIGGPFLNDEGKVARVVDILADGLKPDGVLVAADRFHDGWKKRLPQEKVESICAARGLEVISRNEGISAKKL